MTQQPSQKQIRIPLAVDFACRDFDRLKDSKLQNAIVEKTDKVRIKQRPGSIVTTSTGYSISGCLQALGLFYMYNTQAGAGGAPGHVLGAAYWDGAYKITFVQSGTQYTLSLGAGVSRVPTYFTETSAKNVVLFYTPDGVIRSFHTTTHVFATVVSAGTYFRHLVLFDNYVFALDIGSGAVYNGALSAPTTAWSALDFLEAFPGNQRGMALFRHNNFLVAVGDKSTIFLVDSGHANGSPLSLYPSASQPVGCLFSDSLATINENAFWIATSEQGTPSVVMLPANDLQIKKISSHAVDLLLTEYVQRYSSSTTKDNDNGVQGRCLSVGGKIYYLIDPVNSGYSSPFTFVYDVEAGLWYIWQSSGGQYPYQFIVQTTNLFTLGASTTLVGAFRHQPVPVGFNGLTGEFGVIRYGVSYDYVDENFIPIPIVIQTSLIDFETSFQKQHQRAILVGDRGSPSDATLEYTDDDYATFVSAGTISLVGDIPQSRNLAAARRRAYRISYTALNQADIRFEALELSVAEGSN